MTGAVVVAGALANKVGNGGAAWTRLSWTLGVRALGLQTYFVEQIAPAACIDSTGERAAFRASSNLAWFRRIAGAFDLQATLIFDNGRDVDGISLEQLEAAADGALLINISGHLQLPALFTRFRRRVYIDLDPGFTQCWHAEGHDGARLSGHDAYYTVGENIGRPGCDIPAGDIAWHPIRQPVLLDEWPRADGLGDSRFTTIGSWRGPFGPIQRGGGTWGLKVHQFRRFLDLPARVRAARFELALDIDQRADAGDVAALGAHGWTIADPRAVAGDPWRFREYVRGSMAEFSVAQGIYVDSGSGWFSDRTVRYLASGRPALVQDTGFSANYPVGEGLLAFRTPEDAVQGAQRILADYARHASAARRLAEEYFDARRAVGALVADNLA